MQSNNYSIDIVIPSFRVDESILLNIIQLKKPEGFIISIFIVIDNPALAVPQSIQTLADEGAIQLIINPINLGFSETRNKGIRLGAAKWVLLLDDDIIPNPNLLIAYSKACIKKTDAIGFVGSTHFPKPFNNATLALTLNGSVGQFTAAERQQELMWAPTANILLNRNKIDTALFDESLKKGGEDIEFLVRSALKANEKYIAVPEAGVTHPWWNEGKIQVSRMFRYGRGAAQITDRPAIKKYTYYDFTNTSESLFLLLIFSPLFMFSGALQFLLWIGFSIVLSELLTNWVKAMYLSKSVSLLLGFHLFIVKSMYELGTLAQHIKERNFKAFAKRIDPSFGKQNPSWFRLNKWKIIKIVVLALCFLRMFL